MRRDGRHQQIMFVKSTKPGTHGFKETEIANMGLYQVTAQMQWLLPWCFCETASSGRECVSDSSALSSGRVAFSSLNMRVLSLSYCILVCPLCRILKTCSFLKKKYGGGGVLSKQEVRGIEEDWKVLYKRIYFQIFKKFTK